MKLRKATLVLALVFFLSVSLSPVVFSKAKETTIVPEHVKAAIKDMSLKKEKQEKINAIVEKFYAKRMALRKEKNKLLRSYMRKLRTKKKADYSSFVKEYSRITEDLAKVEMDYVKDLRTGLADEEFTKFFLNIVKARKELRKKHTKKKLEKNVSGQPQK